MFRNARDYLNSYTRLLNQNITASSSSQMKNLYSWMDVAKRTEVVYDHALNSEDDDLLLRLSRYKYYQDEWYNL